MKGMTAIVLTVIMRAIKIIALMRGDSVMMMQHRLIQILFLLQQGCWCLHPCQYTRTHRKNASLAHTYIHICVHISSYQRTMHACIYIYIYIYYVHVHIHTVRIYIYIYTYTHTHTHTYIYIYMFMTHRDLVICRDVYVHPSFFLLGCLPGCLHTRTAACVHAHSRLRGLHLQIRPENPIPLN